MKHLYTPEEFNNSTSESMIPLICIGCNEIFYIKKQKIEYHIKKSSHRTFDFCNSECRKEFRKKNIMSLTKCTNCGCEITKLKSASKRHKNTFCTHSCSTIYFNSNKKQGTRRSKLEIWIEEQLTKLYPNIVIDYNKRDTIKAELDIYIPSLKLAFELNGIFHYEPIFGDDRLKSTKINDNNKFQSCISLGISLCIIDTSKQKYFKESTCRPYLDIITNIINDAICQRTF